MWDVCHQATHHAKLPVVVSDKTLDMKQNEHVCQIKGVY
jgi:hypothetical protein